MAFAHVGSDSDQHESNAGLMTLTFPAGIADGDLGVIVAGVEANGVDPDLTITDEVDWDRHYEKTETPGRDRKLYGWTKRLTGSETSIDMDTSIPSERACALHVFSGLSTSAVLDVDFVIGNHLESYSSDPSNACEPITTATDGALVFLVQHLTLADPISAAGAPAGFTLGEVEIGENRTLIVAYNLDAGTAGTVTPGAWTHTILNSGADVTNITLAFRPEPAAAGTTVNPTTATGTGGASNPSISTTVVAATATATGTAVNPTVSSSVTATPTTATATGTASDAMAGQPDPTGFVSDDFNSLQLNPAWVFVDPRSDCSLDLTGTGTADAYAEISIPSGGSSHDSFGPNRWSPRLAQAVNDVDYDFRAKWDTIPSARFQSQGFQFATDNNNWVRFDVYHDGTDVRLFAATTALSSGTTQFDVIISPTGPSIYLWVTRVGDLWSLSWSNDGLGWSVAETFTHSMIVTGAGPYAGTHTPEPGFVSELDWIEDRNAPLSPADDTGTPGGVDAETATATAGANNPATSVVVNAATATATGSAADARPAVTAVTTTATARATAASALLGPRTADGLISFWGFDEAAGTTIYDLIGDNDLEIEAGGDTTWQTGALTINTASRLETAGPSTGVVEAVQQSGEFTVEGWIIPALASDTGPAVILGMNEDASGPGNFTFGQGDDGGGTPGDVWSLRVQRRGSGNNLGNPGSNTTVGTTLEAGVLRHVAFTVETSGTTLTITRYVNGQLDGSNNRTITAGEAFDDWAPYSLTVANESVNGRAWAGSLFLLALFDRALTPTEISDNYNAGPGIGATIAAAQTATATATANDATVVTQADVTVNPTTATATGTAYDATVSTVAQTTAHAQTATATATAEWTPDSSISLTLIANNPIQVTGTAYDATVSTDTQTTAAATTATATGTANDATVSTQADGTVFPTTATATGQAFWDPGTFISLTMVSESAIQAYGTAYDATVVTQADATVNPTTAAATGSAFNAAVSTDTQATAPAGTATATGTASNATAAITAGSATADATGAADGPLPAVTARPSTATATGIAGNGGVSTDTQATAMPATADATATGVGPAISVTARPSTATAAATATDATVQAYAVGTGQPLTATATGSAADPTPSVTVHPTTATATAVAYRIYPITEAVATGLPDSLQPHSLIRVRPAIGQSSHGNATYDYGPAASRTSLIGWVQQDSRSESFDSGRDALDERWLLMTNFLDIQGLDRIEWLNHPAGAVTFTVNGPTEPAYTDASSDPHHLEATLRIVTG